MTLNSWFSSSYSEARTKFLAACENRSIVMKSYLNPNAKGAQGEALYMDIARIGPENASKVLLLISGTHGVEGYCGSGAQIGLLESGFFDDLAPDTSVMIIHSLNPYGFSHDRRVNEDNIDLNRNFINFESSFRPQTDYSKIHKALVPDEWDGPIRKAADEQLEKFIEEHGLTVFQAAISSGQYIYPDGLFYGGSSSSWSNSVLRELLNKHLAGIQSLAVIDFHTGLGPYGYGELITIGNKAQKDLSSRFYGEQVTDPEAGTSTSAQLNGMMANAIFELKSKTQISFVTLEFGTYEISMVLTALRGDNWLYQKAGLESPEASAIKKDIRKAFYPDTDKWSKRVWSRTQDVVSLALGGLNTISN